MSSKRITIDYHGTIARVIISRPDKLNAFDLAMFIALKQSIKSLMKKRDVRVIVLSGAGDDFSSGLDIKSAFKSPATALRLLWKWLPGNANLAQYVSIGWQKLPVPVIAAIKGRCWGAGMQVALGCDFRIAHPNASLAVMEARWGLIPDMAGNLGLRNNVALDQSLLIAMSADTLDGTQALKAALVTECHLDPEARAMQLAEELCQRSPDALAAIKKLYCQHWHLGQRNMLAKETFYQWRNILSANQRIAVRKQRGDDIAYRPRGLW